MVGKVQEIFHEYEKRLQEMPFIPRGSYGCRMVLQDGGPNRDFITHLFCDHGLAVQFLKDVGLIRSKVQCNTCDRDMTWCAYPSFPDVFKWRCRRMVAGVHCSASRSITTGSWFQLSKLTFREISLVTYHIVCAANLPAVSYKNIASVQVPSLIGACSAGKPFHHSCNYFTSSPTSISTRAMCPPFLTATRNHTTTHLLLQVRVLSRWVNPITSPPPPYHFTDIMLRITSVMAAIFWSSF